MPAVKTRTHNTWFDINEEQQICLRQDRSRHILHCLRITQSTSITGLKFWWAIPLTSIYRSRSNHPIQPDNSKASPARSIAVVSSTQRTMAGVQISTVDLELFERDYRDFFQSVAWTLRSPPHGALIVWRVDRSNLFWIRYKVLICCFCYWDCTWCRVNA